MQHVSSATDLSVRTALSANIDAMLAAEQVCEQIREGRDGSDESASLQQTIDLALVFVGGDHATQAARIYEQVQKRLSPGLLLGVTAQSVIGDDVELENAPGVSLLCASLPGTQLQGFTYRQLPHATPSDRDAMLSLAEEVGAGPDSRAILFFGDPFSVPGGPLVDALSALPRVVPGLRRLPVVGGMASAGKVPGQNIIALNDHTMRTGGAGVMIRGDITMDTLVSQGCRPIGQPLVITEAKRNVVQSLGGRPAMQVVRDMVDALSNEDRALVSGGLFIGRVVNEYKDRFGRGDFLIRAVLGVDQGSGAIAVGDSLRVGQTVQFQLRDATTAREDLELLLEAQQLLGPAAGGLLCTCSGRGRRLFSSANHDAALISRRLGAQADPLAARPMPMGGFFAAGEIGPIGDRSFVHGHTASVALFRPLRLSFDEAH
ncbi:MAG: FIST N-terminal domain-containing protein [Phycisphaerales bacterium]